MQVRLSFLLLLAALAAPAAPVTLYSDFGPGQTYDLDTGYSLGGSNNYTQAAAFTPDVSGKLVSIDLPLSYVIRSNAVVWLMTNVDGRPGSVLEQFTVTGIMGASRIFTLTSVSHPLLLAGTQYWVAAADAAGTDGRIAWHSSTSTTGLLATRYGSAPWPDPTLRNLPAFDVVGEAIPEPSSLATLVLGLLVLAGRQTLRTRIG